MDRMAHDAVTDNGNAAAQAVERSGAAGAAGSDDSGPAFTPPTAEQWAEHLRRHDLGRSTSGGGSSGLGLLSKLPVVLLVGVGVLGLMLFVSGERGGLLVLLWVTLVGLMVWGAWRGRRMRGLEREIREMDDLGVLRDWAGALSIGWRLLPRVRGQPGAWAKVVAIMGRGLAEVGAWGASMVSVETLLGRLPAEHPAGAGLRLSRAVLALRLDRLGDADDDLRRVRRMLGEMDPINGGSDTLPFRPGEREGLAAGFAYAGLVQDVVTHHFAEGVERGDRLVERLRPMGMEAGYGYGLMALCHWKVGDADGARRWWTRAVLLVPSKALVRRYAMLNEIAALEVMGWRESVVGLAGDEAQKTAAERLERREPAGHEAVEGGLGVFDWAALERELRKDDRLRGLLVGGTLGLLLIALLLDGSGWGLAAVLPVLGLVAWGVLASWSARVSRRLPVVAELVERGERDWAAAERELAGLLERRLVVRGLRLGVVRWWAVLRHRQERWAEASAVCVAVLGRLGVSARRGSGRGKRSLRGPLGLILAESRLEEGDLWGAYAGLSGLAGERLTLMEGLRRLALVSRYEVMAEVGLGAGPTGTATAERRGLLRERVGYAELLPGRACGAAHGVLAEAARRSGDDETAAWLSARVVLLGGGAGGSAGGGAGGGAGGDRLRGAGSV
ncbi:MAG: hypothetical protein AAGI68_07235 [Planctomycetota bacterium]